MATEAVRKRMQFYVVDAQVCVERQDQDHSCFPGNEQFPRHMLRLPV